jgi:DNA-binding transcriptional ArsR family regulator
VQGEKKAEASEIVDPRIVKALAHPLRVQILATLSHRTISPAEFSREHGASLSDVAYHFRTLEKLECAELVKTVPVRGSTQHFYSGTTRPLLNDRAWRELPRSVQAGISGAALKDLVGRVADAVCSGTFDARPDRHLSWMPLRVDPHGWDELMAILESALAQATEVEIAASKRMAKSGEEGICATFALMGFESPSDTAKC